MKLHKELSSGNTPVAVVSRGRKVLGPFTMARVEHTASVCLRSLHRSGPGRSPEAAVTAEVSHEDSGDDREDPWKAAHIGGASASHVRGRSGRFRNVWEALRWGGGGSGLPTWEGGRPSQPHTEGGQETFRFCEGPKFLKILDTPLKRNANAHFLDVLGIFFRV